MDDVFAILSEAQHLIGGVIAFLECEKNDKLLQFYQNDNKRFKRYEKRFSEIEYKKYLRSLNFFEEYINPSQRTWLFYFIANLSL